MSRAISGICVAAFLACMLAFAFSVSGAQAQDQTSPPPLSDAQTPPQAALMPGPEQEPENELAQQGMERQDVREEMQRIRSEHEDMEAKHDALKAQCLNAKGQEHTACRQQWNALRQQRGALHERMRNLHEKMATFRQDYRGPGNADSNRRPAMFNKDQPPRENPAQ